jgi:hypothetical protein
MKSTRAVNRELLALAARVRDARAPAAARGVLEGIAEGLAEAERGLRCLVPSHVRAGRATLQAVQERARSPELDSAISEEITESIERIVALLPGQARTGRGRARPRQHKPSRPKRSGRGHGRPRGCTTATTTTPAQVPGGLVRLAAVAQELERGWLELQRLVRELGGGGAG